MRYQTAAVVGFIVLGACAWKRTPVPLISDNGSAALLVGTWSGEYTSEATGRSGSITFEMASEKDTAYCDVVMIPRLQNFQAPIREHAGAPVVRSELFPQPLKIQFIRLGDRRVSGTLDPYLDPDCNCVVKTTFEGEVVSTNTITGTFTTRGDGVQASSGTWKVNRQGSKVGNQ